MFRIRVISRVTAICFQFPSADTIITVNTIPYLVCVASYRRYVIAASRFTNISQFLLHPTCNAYIAFQTQIQF